MSRNHKAKNNTAQVLKSFAQIKTAVNRLPASPGEWQEDGVDHICVDHMAATELGRALSTRNDVNWSHPVLGYFRSLDNLWYFLSVGKPHDALRRLQRREAMEFARNECGGLAYYPNIEAVFLDSFYRYLKSRNRTDGNKRSIVTQLIECELPFDIYYTNRGGIRSRRSTNLWLLDGYYEIQKAFRENREPDLKPWITHPEQHIYHDIMVALGADPEQTEQLFQKAVEARESYRVRQRPRPEQNGRVIKERAIQSIDPSDGFKVKVRDAAKDSGPEVKSDPAEESPEGSDVINTTDVDQPVVAVIVSSAFTEDITIQSEVSVVEESPLSETTTVVDAGADLDAAVVTTITDEPVASEDGVLVEGAVVSRQDDLKIQTQAALDPYAYARNSEGGEVAEVSSMKTATMESRPAAIQTLSEETPLSGSVKSDDTASVNHSV